MEAIILAGGFGTRLKQVVSDVPKPMAPIAGRPFLEILLNSLSRKGFERVVLSLGYMSETVISYFGNRYANIDLIYAVESTPLGTGGAIRKAMKFCLGDHAFIFNGDTFLDLEAADVEQRWLRNRTPIIVGQEVLDTSRYGRLKIEGDRVIGFQEKGTLGPGLINAGCYVFPTCMLDDFKENHPFSIETDFLLHAVESMRFELFATQAYFIDIGVPSDYLKAQKELDFIQNI